MLDYKGNSFKEREGLVEKNNRPELEAIVSPKKERKKSFVNKFLKGWGPELGDFIVNDLVIPNLGNIAQDAIGYLFNGDNYVPSRKSSKIVTFDSGRRSRRRDYDDYFDDDRRSRRYARPRERDEWNSIIFESRADALQVLNEMYDYACRYDYVSIANFYSLCGKTDYPHTYNDYGWSSEALRSAEEFSDYGDWKINFPKPKSIV